MPAKALKRNWVFEERLTTALRLSDSFYGLVTLPDMAYLQEHQIARMRVGVSLADCSGRTLAASGRNANTPYP